MLVKPTSTTLHIATARIPSAVVKHMGSPGQPSRDAFGHPTLRSGGSLSGRVEVALPPLPS